MFINDNLQACSAGCSLTCHVATEALTALRHPAAQQHPDLGLLPPPLRRAGEPGPGQDARFPAAAQPLVPPQLLPSLHVACLVRATGDLHMTTRGKETHGRIMFAASRCDASFRLFGRSQPAALTPKPTCLPNVLAQFASHVQLRSCRHLQVTIVSL